MIGKVMRIIRCILDPTAALRAENASATQRASETAEAVQKCLAEHEAARDPLASLVHHVRGRQQRRIAREDESEE